MVTRAEAIESLRGLVERVVLSPIEGGFEDELVGAIATMVKFPADARSFGRDPFRSSVRVVVGPGTLP